MIQIKRYTTGRKTLHRSEMRINRTIITTDINWFTSRVSRICCLLLAIKAGFLPNRNARNVPSTVVGATSNSKNRLSNNCIRFLESNNYPQKLFRPSSGTGPSSFGERRLNLIVRGGASLNSDKSNEIEDGDHDEEEDENEFEEEGEEEEVEVEVEVEVEEEEEEEDEVEVEVEVEEEDDSDSDEIGAETTELEISKTSSFSKYDDPLVPSPFINLYASVAVMILARKYDLFHPIMVKIARFAFILYMISLQCFLLFVRIKAKIRNDRTPLEVTNPLSKILQNQLGGNSSGSVSGSMLTSLASSFLSSSSTAVEYDLKQAEQMQRGLIFNMLFMWVLHFKMEQVQPLFINTVTGLSNMIYSPLFQVYVMGRNLERPFKGQATDQEEKALETAETKDDDESSSPSEEDNDEDLKDVSDDDS